MTTVEEKVMLQEARDAIRCYGEFGRNGLQIRGCFKEKKKSAARAWARKPCLRLLMRTALPEWWWTPELGPMSVTVAALDNKK